MSWASLWRRSRITREPGGANEKRSVHLFRLQGLRSGASPELDKLAVVGADTVFLEQLLSDEAGATRSATFCPTGHDWAVGFTAARFVTASLAQVARNDRLAQKNYPKPAVHAPSRSL